MDLYYLAASAPCRAVMMTGKSLGIELNKKVVNLWAGEHLKPEYLKLNPQHTVPTLVDGDFVMSESRAIMIYLVEKYAKNDTLYPKCPKKQAVINQRLYFDMGTLCTSYVNYYYPKLLQKTPGDPEMFKKIESAFDLLNTFLADSKYTAADSMTIADFALLASVSIFKVVGFDLGKYPNVARWYADCETTVPGFAENWEGCLDLKKFYDSL